MRTIIAAAAALAIASALTGPARADRCADALEPLRGTLERSQARMGEISQRGLRHVELVAAAKKSLSAVRETIEPGDAVAVVTLMANIIKDLFTAFRGMLQIVKDYNAAWRDREAIVFHALKVCSR